MSTSKGVIKRLQCQIMRFEPSNVSNFPLHYNNNEPPSLSFCGNIRKHLCKLFKFTDFHPNIAFCDTYIYLNKWTLKLSRGTNHVVVEEVIVLAMCRVQVVSHLKPDGDAFATFD